MKTNKDKQNEIAEKAIAQAKTIKEVAEQNMREKLYEAFSPQLKKMISQSILEMDDDEEDMDMDDMDMDEGDMDYDDEEYMEEEEGSDAEADELDPEDLEDLEKALDEEEGEEDDVEDLDGDGHVEVPTDEDDPEDMEDMEEGSDDYDDMEDESPEDFMAELQALIDEVDAEELNESESMDESEDGGSYTDKDKGSGEHTKKYEGNEDGGSYTDKDKGSGEHTKKYEGEDEEDDVDALKEENEKLKATISEINKQLQETVLDEYKTNKFTKLVKEHNITETAKLKLMRAIDSGHSEKEVNRIAEVFERSLPKKKKSTKKSIQESKGGKNSSVRKPLSKKKNLKENKNASSSGYNFDRWAELADIS